MMQENIINNAFELDHLIKIILAKVGFEPSISRSLYGNCFKHQYRRVYVLKKSNSGIVLVTLCI